MFYAIGKLPRHVKRSQAAGLLPENVAAIRVTYLRYQTPWA